jgi:DNA-binding MarR family transcriptional regulator
MPTDSANPPELAGQVDATMAAARVLAGVTAESVAEVEDQVTPAQLRVLMILTTRGPSTLSAVAEALGVHPSNATRHCDRLVTAGLLDRADARNDRRKLRLTVTRAGADLIDSVVQHRRAALERVLRRMTGTDRELLATALGAFGAAAGELPDHGYWSH